MKFSSYRDVIRKSYLAARAVKSILISRYKNGQPFFISHLITSRCFAKCPTCLWRGNSPEEMDTDRIIDFYRQAKQHGFVSTTIWGGEPLLRRDLFDILKACKTFGFVTGIITNGYLLPDYASRLAHTVDFIIISIDFPTEAHDRYRGVHGLLHKTKSGLNLVRSENPHLKVFINSVVSRYNFSYVPALVNFAESLDTTITFESVQEGAVRYRQDKKVEHMRLLPKDEQRIFALIRYLKKKHRCINNSNAYLDLFANGSLFYHCHALKVCIRVEPDGNVPNCMDRTVSLGNVYQQNLADILKSDKMKKCQQQAERCCSCVDSGVIESSLFWDFNLKSIINLPKLFLG